MTQTPLPDEASAREIAELEMLAQDANPAAIRKLREALRHDRAVVRQVAATSLGRIGNAVAVPHLVDAVRDPSPEVRRSAVWALGQIKHSGAVGALRGALQDKDSDVRRTAVWALGRVGQGRDLPDLIAAKSDTDYLVRRSAGAVTAGAAISGGTSAQPIVRAKRKSSDWPLILLGVAGLVIIIGAVAVAVLWARPLGPELVSLEPPAQAGESLDSPVAVAETVQCGGPPIMKLLMIGLDSDGYYRGFADVIRVARIDFVTPSVIVLGVPRDLWVTIPGLERYNISEDRIKMAYPYGNVDRVPGGGPSLLAQTLAFNLGLQVTRYMATDFATFEAGIDQIGGVDIYLPKDVGNTQTDPPFFPAGWTHMDGKTALRYARVRPDNSSDLARMDRQNQLIVAIRDKVTRSDFMPQLPAIINQMKGSIATDLSPSEISSLLCIAQKVQPDQTSIVKIDKPLVLSVTDAYGYERLLPDQAAVRNFVRDFDKGDLDALHRAVRP